MKVLTDTEIFLDLLAMRKPHYYDVAKLFSLAERGRIQVHASAYSIASINHILSKEKTVMETRTVLRKIQLIVRVLALDKKIINLSLSDNYFDSFEDGLHYYTAVENEIEAMVTKTPRLYEMSDIPVMTPKQFINSFGIQF